MVAAAVVVVVVVGEEYFDDVDWDDGDFWMWVTQHCSKMLMTMVERLSKKSEKLPAHDGY